MKKLLIIPLLLACLATKANAGLTLNLNTGVYSSGAFISPGSRDDSYRLIAEPTPIPSVGAAAYVVPNSTFPIPPWYNTPGQSAQWISINASGGESPAAPAGNYDYRITFNLPAWAVSSAKITGQWSTDNTGNDIKINGASTGQTIAYGTDGTYSFLTLHDFTVNSGFHSGNNTLDFLVHNGNGGSDTAGPTGLYVQANLTAVPEASTYFAGLGALALVGLFGSRRSNVIRIGSR